ncbi:helix-turn-helix domain-containing protein [Aneurinibacillus danicus]|uniref:Helix-turn-helix domain-containing protein n=1 Tax=Aneurinibacillus danicus TaxID=267746 RepID=A0A511VAU0_9BACL|nr:helix-turn-helix domain-containing protein [Aneurinibacillus danicus]GEN35944.1 hypothetical protein ADA01nite_34040 [Aneurinibacillus danicus]
MKDKMVSQKEIQNIEELLPQLSEKVTQFVKFEQYQEEIVRGLSPEDWESIQKLSEFSPRYAAIIKRMLPPVNAVQVADSSFYDFNAFETSGDPEFLSPGEVADLLGITPQMVRRYCKEGAIPAYRTLGNRGSWRIDTKHFFAKYPDKRDLFRERIQEDKRRTKEVIEALNEMAKTGEYDALLDDNKES